jgi:hypothetical protein
MTSRTVCARLLLRNSFVVLGVSTQIFLHLRSTRLALVGSTIRQYKYIHVNVRVPSKRDVRTAISSLTIRK